MKICFFFDDLLGGGAARVVTLLGGNATHRPESQGMIVTALVFLNTGKEPFFPFSALVNIQLGLRSGCRRRYTVRSCACNIRPHFRPKMIGYLGNR